MGARHGARLPGARAGQRFTRVATLAVVLAAASASARNPEAPETHAAQETTFLDHSGDNPLWFGAEMNSILQYKPSFRALYSGPMSLSSDSEAAVSGLMTVFFAYTPFKTTELIADLEMALGTGLSGAVGLAGFTNLDVVRNPTLGHEPYVARVELHQLIPLSTEWEPNEDRGPISSFAYVPRHRLELRIGKMSTADLFDINPSGSDSHMQFMNWAVDNNGAYDYAADTRGYTWGIVIEYQGPYVEVRLGEMMMPTVANGLELDSDLLAAHADNLEVEVKYLRREGFRGTLRLLGYMNHARMGSYQAALEGPEMPPDITAHRARGRTKTGFGVNLIQELFGRGHFFARGGWNDGKNESFAYTEIDDTVEVGLDVVGALWRRTNDKLGVAFVTNGLSSGHREYLRRGGVGFLLGDGTLTYGRETIVEAYYNAQIWRGAFAAADVQFITNPAYNSDRGPLWVLSLRGHLEF
jgi:hypothetical protein